MSRPRPVAASLVGAILLLLAGPARGDVLQLRDGRTLEGRVVAAGPGRLLIDGSSGLSFVERADVLAHRDGSGEAVPSPAPDVADPVGLIKMVEGPVRRQRRAQELAASIHGSAAVVLDGDELRTGPYGRVQLLLAAGAVASARDDAILRFRGGTVELEEGTLRLEAEGSSAFARVPGGRLEVVDGKAEAEHLRERTRLVVISGRASFSADAGYRLELPRSHAADVRMEQAHEPASVAASNTNAWPLRLEFGARRVSVQPGERVILLGIPSPASLASGAPALPPSPTPREAPDTAAPPRGDDRTAGRLVRTASSVLLHRRDLPPRRIDQAEARDLTLLPGDVLETESGEAAIESGAARLAVQGGSRVRVLGQGNGAPLALLAGEGVLETSDRTSLGLPGGEVGLLSGRLAVRTRPREESSARTELSLVAGTAGARFGAAVRAELLAPAELEVDATAAEVGLRVPTGAQAVPVTLGGLDLQLRPGAGARYARTGELETVELGSTRIELVGGVRARIVGGPGEQDVLELAADRSRIPLGPGTFRFAREGQRVLADVPPPARRTTPEATVTRPSEPEPSPASTAGAATVGDRAETVAASGEQRHELPGGVVVVTRGWAGPLSVQRSTPAGVTVDTPAGEVVLAPKSRIVLARLGETTRIQTSDGRLVTHEDGAGRCTVHLEQDGTLRLEVFSGPQRRSVEVERGVEFDLAIRSDSYVLSYVFGQAIYVEPGRHLSVSQAQGLRSYMAAERGE